MKKKSLYSITLIALSGLIYPQETSPIPLRQDESVVYVSPSQGASRAKKMGEGRDLSEVIGVTHVAGRYRLTQKDFMSEGVDLIQSLGTKVVKIWLTENPETKYPYNSAWPQSIKSLQDLVQTDYYKATFAKPFKHYILETTSFGIPHFKRGFTAKEAHIESAQIYELTKYLLITYQNTGKTFVIQNWEGDNAVNASKLTPQEQDLAFKGMIDWMNCRQEAVDRARNEMGMKGVRVVNCLEMNRVPSSKETFAVPLVVDRVVPFTRCDLYSISTWGTKIAGTEDNLFEKLEYISKKAPDSAIYGSKNVMVGEFGAPESIYKLAKNTYMELKENPDDAQYTVVRKQLESALRWGAVYIVYWQLYCNEFKDDSYIKGVPKVKQGAVENRDTLVVYSLI